jgi:hypothetical protein
MPRIRQVRHFSTLLALLLIGGLHLPAALDDWAETWTAAYKGKPYLILKLDSGAGRLSGTLSAGQVETDEQGNVTAIEQPPSAALPLKSMKLTGGTLSFETIDSDGDAIHYAMRLTADGGAELRLPGAPIKLAPFALTRN